MPRDETANSEPSGYAETTLWMAAGLLGPVPWILLLTRELERFWGATGYSVAFVAAPALWTGLAAAVLLTDRRRWSIVWAVVGAALWWLSVG